MLFPSTAPLDCCDLPAYTDAATANRGHVSRILGYHGLRLVDVLSCREECDGATYSVLARNPSGDLVRANLWSEPGYDECDVVSHL